MEWEIPAAAAFIASTEAVMAWKCSSVCSAALIATVRAANVGRDVGGILDDLRQAPVRVEDRVVARLDPDGAPALGEALEHAGRELAPAQSLPERRIVRGSRVVGVHEHRVRLTPHLLDPVADRRQEVLVRVQHRGIGGELDHRL